MCIRPIWTITRRWRPLPQHGKKPGKRLQERWSSSTRMSSPPTCARLLASSYRKRSEAGQQATGATAETVRLAGCLDALSGRIVWRRRSRFNVKEMYRFFYYVQKQYPQAKVIYMALDNWPIHFHA